MVCLQGAAIDLEVLGEKDQRQFTRYLVLL